MTNTLFANPKRAAKPGRAPDWVIERLTKLGIPERVARKLPVRAAFGRMYDLERKARVPSAEFKASEASRLSALLSGLTEEEDAAVIQDAINEALVILNSGELTRVSRGLAAFLRELAA